MGKLSYDWMMTVYWEMCVQAYRAKRQRDIYLFIAVLLFYKGILNHL